MRIIGSCNIQAIVNEKTDKIVPFEINGRISGTNSIRSQFGFFTMLIALLAAISIIIARVFFIDFQLGWPSLMITVIMGFGVNIFFMGIIGIYIGKIYKETKARPLFSVKELTNIEHEN